MRHPLKEGTKVHISPGWNSKKAVGKAKTGVIKTVNQSFSMDCALGSSSPDYYYEVGIGRKVVTLFQSEVTPFENMCVHIPKYVCGTSFLKEKKKCVGYAPKEGTAKCLHEQLEGNLCKNQDLYKGAR